MFSLFHHHHLSSSTSSFCYRVEGLGWQKFTVEIKNNAFQNDTLNTIEARSESGDIIHQSELFVGSSGWKRLFDNFLDDLAFLVWTRSLAIRLNLLAMFLPDEETFLLVFVIHNVHHNNFKLCNSNLEGSICHSAAIHPSTKPKHSRIFFLQHRFLVRFASVGGRKVQLQPKKKAIFSWIWKVSEMIPDAFGRTKITQSLIWEKENVHE